MVEVPPGVRFSHHGREYVGPANLVGLTTDKDVAEHLEGAQPERGTAARNNTNSVVVQAMSLMQNLALDGTSVEPGLLASLLRTTPALIVARREWCGRIPEGFKLKPAWAAAVERVDYVARLRDQESLSSESKDAEDIYQMTFGGTADTGEPSRTPVKQLFDGADPHGSLVRSGQVKELMEHYMVTRDEARDMVMNLDPDGLDQLLASAHKRARIDEPQQLVNEFADGAGGDQAQRGTHLAFTQSNALLAALARGGRTELGQTVGPGAPLYARDFCTL